MTDTSHPKLWKIAARPPQATTLKPGTVFKYFIEEAGEHPYITARKVLNNARMGNYQIASLATA
jgi:hypothetical protein